MWSVLLGVAPDALGQIYSSRVTTASDAVLNVSSYGVLGNNFTVRTASFEYPGGAGYDHLTHAGLWVGARTEDTLGSFTGVTTGGMDQFPGDNPTSLTEWSPLSNGFMLLSSNPSSGQYDPTALSPDESIVFFDDHVARRALGEPETNRPLGVRVRQTTHAWDAAGYRDFVVVRFVVTSQTAHPLNDIWVGLYAELASGPKSLYATWPPNGTWFSKKLLEWDSSWRMVREHYCSSPPVPTACHFEVVPPWVGLQLLTPPAIGQHVTLAAWSWAPGATTRDEDSERYPLMSTGAVQDLSDPSLQPRDGDPVELLAVGPYSLAESGDSLEVAFAFVGGADVPSLEQHARSAQALHDAGYSLALVNAEAPALPLRLSLTAVGNPSTRNGPEFVLELPAASQVRIELFDTSGRRVASQQLGILPAGRNSVRLAGAASLAPGVYLARLAGAAGEKAVARFVWLR